MAGLQRSSVSFRRQGSSGLIWNDNFVSGESKSINRRHGEQQQPPHESDEPDSLFRELRSSRSVGSSGSFERSRSSAGMEVMSPSPPRTAKPSPPRFAGCGFCGVFGRPVGSPRHQKSHKR